MVYPFYEIRKQMAGSAGKETQTRILIRLPERFSGAFLLFDNGPRKM
jgi:hypothetical protein